MDVLLNDAGSPLCPCAFLDDSLNFTVFLGDLDSLPTVSILTRLDNPHIQLVVVLSVLVIFIEFFKVGVSNAIFDMECHR